MHPEHEISPATQSEIAELLETCFPEIFEGRTYYKQLPHFRLLVPAGGKIVAQLGIDSRVINVDGQVLRIFGIIDLCVHPAHRGKGIASGLLAQVEQLGRRHECDFLVLMADRHDLYRKAGFERVAPAPAKWLGIDERKSIGMIQRDLADCFMVKPLSSQPWPPGEIDLLGYLF